LKNSGDFFKKGKEYGRGNWLYGIFINNKDCGERGKESKKLFNEWEYFIAAVGVFTGCISIFR